MTARSGRSWATCFIVAIPRRALLARSHSGIRDPHQLCSPPCAEQRRNASRCGTTRRGAPNPKLNKCWRAPTTRPSRTRGRQTRSPRTLQKVPRRPGAGNLRRRCAACRRPRSCLRRQCHLPSSKSWSPKGSLSRCLRPRTICMSSRGIDAFEGTRVEARLVV